MRLFRICTRTLGGAFLLPLTVTAQTFTTLYNFGSQSYDGAYPKTGVIPGLQGELYGTTNLGGERNLGTVYVLLPPASSGAAWTEIVLHSFNGTDGEYPGAALLRGPSGALYGVTPRSTVGYGTIFTLDPPTGGSTHWPSSILYRFPDLDTGSPSGALVFGAYGSMYGAIDARYGAAYSLTPPAVAGGAWSETTIYSFPGRSGGHPTGRLAVNSNGTLFGVTANGGWIDSACPLGCGTVFSLRPPAQSGGAWMEQVLYGFKSPEW